MSDDIAASAPRDFGAGVRMERAGPVATIVIDLPHKRNAVDRATANALRAAFTAFEADDALHVAVLWGAGGTFCAGADLTALSDDARRNEIDPDGVGAGPMGPTRMPLAKPAIAAISGYAVAGGLELALLCDLRVVEEDAVFGVFCRRWGVPLIDGGTVRLPRLIGLSRAFDMILTGRAVGADEALQFGLASRVVPSGEARAAAEALAREIAAFPQRCMLTDRRSAYSAWDADVAEALTREGAAGYEVVFAEGIAGASAFAAGAGRHGAFTTGPGRQ
ncbi:MAG: enoyl-CoA hydratase/isomerase family protein [Candidatus Eremiobacteraeota bacterium]|nr:enoyl-CoA hydratase/isomerase family protein [Candidatus Eremiobacteraeota bacterium]